jgi:hypothetical protein
MLNCLMMASLPAFAYIQCVAIQSYLPVLDFG